MREPRSSRKQRGAAAVEFALAMPALLLIAAGGIQLGRALTTRHELEEAVSFATRAAAVSSQGNPAAINQGAILTAVQHRLTTGELARCAPLDVQAQVVDGAFPGAKAVQVTAVCHFVPVFRNQQWSAMGVSELTIHVAMPL